jgi:hypothetical protein
MACGMVSVILILMSRQAGTFAVTSAQRHDVMASARNAILSRRMTGSLTWAIGDDSGGWRGGLSEREFPQQHNSGVMTVERKGVRVHKHATDCSDKAFWAVVLGSTIARTNDCKGNGTSGDGHSVTVDDTHNDARRCGREEVTDGSGNESGGEQTAAATNQAENRRSTKRQHC